MNTVCRILATPLTLLLILLCAINVVPAQIEKNIYKKFGAKEGIAGEESYFIQTNIRDTIRAGFYDMKAFQHVAESNKIKKSTLKGNYKENKKIGKWGYTFDNYEVTFDSLQNLSVYTHLNGERYRMNQWYKEGSPDSTWTYRKEIIQKDTVQRVVIEATTNWKSGLFQYLDKHTDRHISVEGYFNKEGYLDGEWVMIYDFGGTLLEEKRQYVSGTLIKYSLSEKSTGFALEDEVFQEIVKLIETGKDTIEFEDYLFIKQNIPSNQLSTINLASSREMDFQYADKQIKDAIFAWFDPQFLGKKQTAIHSDQFGKTKAFRRSWKPIFVSNLDKIRSQKLPSIKAQIKTLAADKVLNTQVNDMPEIKQYLDYLENLASITNQLESTLTHLLSSEYAYRSVIDRYSKINTSEFESLYSSYKDIQKGNLKEWRTLDSKSTFEQIESITKQIEIAIADADRYAKDLKNTLEKQKSLSKLVSEIYEVKHEIQEGSWGTSKPIYGDKKEVTSSDFNPIQLIEEIKYYLKTQFGINQMNFMFEELESVENMQTKQVIARSIKDYQQEILTIKDQQLPSLLNIVQNLDSNYRNPKGKRIYSTFFESGIQIIEHDILKIKMMQDFSGLKSSLNDLKVFSEQLSMLSKSDPKKVKDLEKRLKKETNLTDRKALILEL